MRGEGPIPHTRDESTTASACRPSLLKSCSMTPFASEWMSRFLVILFIPTSEAGTNATIGFTRMIEAAPALQEQGWLLSGAARQDVLHLHRPGFGSFYSPRPWLFVAPWWE
jgi:hypothetical protein